VSPLRAQMSDTLKRRLLVTTENLHTVTWFANVSRHSDWAVRFTDGIVHTPALDQLEDDVNGRSAISPDVLHMLMNLDLALEADGFVGTFTSNWCRCAPGAKGGGSIFLLWRFCAAAPEAWLAWQQMEGGDRPRLVQ
jgi:hypothetical protein